MSRQDEELDAAEYVIGTLSGAERAAFEVLAESDESVRNDISFWQRIFGDLSGTVSPVIPDASVWKRIESALPMDDQRRPGLGLAQAVERTNVALTQSDDAVETNSGATGGLSDKDTLSAAVSEAKKPMSANDNAAAMQRSRSRWRFGAIAASLAALGFGYLLFNQDARSRVDGALNAGLFNQETSQQVAQDTPAGDSSKDYIAVVNANADQPALIVRVNTETGNVTVRSLGIENPEGKSLELWYVPEGKDAISVGLLGDAKLALEGVPAKGGDLLAISVEPVGGAPEGVATGPIIYTGKLVEDVDASQN